MATRTALASVRPAMERSLSRTVASLPAVLQIAGAATAGYAIAHFAFGHPTPIFSSTVAITALGFSRDARPIRVAETALGIILGIVLADLLLLGIGRGWWQLFVVLVVTLLAGRLLSPSIGFAAAAGVQSALVTLFPVASGTEFTRVLDGLIGGAVALVATALIPRDPRRAALRDARLLFDECTEALAAITAALRIADADAAVRALSRLRMTQPLVDAWATSLESGSAVARISPFLRRHLADFDRQRRVQRGMDLATRNLRIIARRVEFLVPDGRPRPELAELLGTISECITLLGRALRAPGLFEVARRDLTVLAKHLHPALLDEPSISETMVLVLIRPLIVDLLTATGMDEDEARALLPPLPA